MTKIGTHEIFLTMNEKVMFFIHWRLQRTKIFYHKQISYENINGKFFFQTMVYCSPFNFREMEPLMKLAVKSGTKGDLL